MEEYRLLTQNSDYNSESRVLKHIPHKTKLDPTRMTVQACVAACQLDGWNDAGLEFGRECYCDNGTYPIGQSTPLMDCDMPCDGDASQFVSRRLIAKMRCKLTHDIGFVVAPSGCWSITKVRRLDLYHVAWSDVSPPRDDTHIELVLFRTRKP
jgi:WSC domain